MPLSCQSWDNPPNRRPIVYIFWGTRCRWIVINDLPLWSPQAAYLSYLSLNHLGPVLRRYMLASYGFIWDHFTVLEFEWASVGYLCSIYMLFLMENIRQSPVDMVEHSLFKGFYTSQVVQDFFHQQYLCLHSHRKFFSINVNLAYLLSCLVSLWLAANQLAPHLMYPRRKIRPY